MATDSISFICAALTEKEFDDVTDGTTVGETTPQEQSFGIFRSGDTNASLCSACVFVSFCGRLSNARHSDGIIGMSGKFEFQSDSCVAFVCGGS